MAIDDVAQAAHYDDPSRPDRRPSQTRLTPTMLYGRDGGRLRLGLVSRFSPARDGIQ